LVRQAFSVPPSRDALIDSFATLAHHVTRRYHHWSLDADDFFQEAMLSAIRAIDDFRVDRNIPLGAYVANKMRWAIGHQLERANLQSRTSGTLYKDPADQLVDEDDIQDELWDHIEQLPPRDQSILIGFFGLDNRAPETRAQLGKRHKCCSATISRSTARSTNTLRTALTA
jgi:RNA polymerase sigma factor (sigma-70 family)